MADQRVKVYDSQGQYGSVDAKDVDALVRSGGRVATKEEVAAAHAQAEYDAQSTLQKVGTVATMLGPVGYAAHLAMRADGAKLDPRLEAYTQGVSKGMTGGLASVGMKEAIRQVGGDGAAKAYAQTAQETAKAYSGMHSAGEVAGVIGGAVAAAESGVARAALPGAGISAVGGAVEGVAARGLTKALGTGVMGRAGVAAGSLAARGATEGALLMGAQQLSEDMLGDHELAAEKVLAAAGTGALYGAAGGAVLGGAGSLAGSGIRGVAGAARRGLSRAAARVGRGAAEEAGAAARALDDVAAGEARAAAVPGAKPSPFSPEGMTARAEEAADTLALDALGARQTTLAKVAPGKTIGHGPWHTSFSAKGIDGVKARSIGRWVRENILRTGADDASTIGVAMRGRADDMIPAIVEKKNAIGKQIGDMVRGHNHEIDLGDIMRMADDRHGVMLKSEKLRPNAHALRSRFDESMEALNARGEIRDVIRDAETNRIIGGKVDLADMYGSRQAMEGAAYEMRVASGTAHDEFKTLMREIDDHLVTKMDDVAGKTSDKTARELIKELKHEYHMAASAERLAEDGAKRIAGNNVFGIRETIGAAAGLATGNPLLALGTMVGGKVLRERGSAAGAYLLSRMAETGTVARMVAKVDSAIGNAARGMVEPAAVKLPKTTGSPYRGGNIRVRAAQIAKRVADVQAEPEAAADRIARATQPISGSHPNVASNYQAGVIRAAAFLNSKIPVRPDHDPLDPHPAPRMTDSQAASLVRTAEYCDNPMRFFEDAARGKITPEGVEVARALMPKAFAELQQRTVSQMAEYMAHGRKIPHARRERLGVLLGIPLVPSQRPEHRKFLQNLLQSEQKDGQPKPSNRPIPTRGQPSALDRLERGNGIRN